MVNVMNEEYKEDYLIDQDNRSGDIGFIKDMVKEGGVEVLVPDELETYIKYAQQDMPDDSGGWHYENLADNVDEASLSKIASDIINWVDWDEESRDDWAKREAKGIKLLGVSDETEGGASFEGASRVVHPLIMEGIVQFQSRAIAELWPKSGPVKAIIAGDKTPELLDKADRVEKYGNYLYTKKMPGAFEEMDQLLFRLPMSGSCFKKVYYDPISEVICSRLVEPSDFIVPYSATDLASAPRYTHRVREQKNDVLKKVKLGYYRDTRLSRPLGDEEDYPEVREQIERSQGISRNNNHEGDQRYTILECYCDYDLPGFEDTNEQGEETGIALPYIITINRDDQTVLRIQRNWKEEDIRKKKRMNFAHYKFTPGFGFYGFGLLHLIGGLGESATGSLRALLDSAQHENMQSGYVSEDCRIESNDKPIAPGEWRRTKSTAEELSKSFFPMPKSSPSGVLFNLMGYLDEKAQRLASTTDAMVGDVPASMPVGTAMQNTENGSKVFSAIHARLHEAQTKEFAITIDLIRDYIPEDGYPYALEGASGVIMYDDFSDEINVIPISDPNLVSNAHRIAQAQGILQLGKETGEINMTVATKRMLEAMRVSGIDELMEKQENPLQLQQLQLELDKMKVDIENKIATTDKLKSQATGEKLKSQYTAMQSAQVAVSVPPVLPVADEMLLSAGYEDNNGAPVASQPMQEQMPENQTNTDPRFPVQPESPADGVNGGIETPENDGVL